jgi:hypothetical protein
MNDIYLHIYVDIYHIYIYIYISVCMYIYIYVRVCVCVCVCVCVLRPFVSDCAQCVILAPNRWKSIFHVLVQLAVLLCSELCHLKEKVIN